MGGPTVIMSATFWHLYDIAAATTYSDLTMIAPSCAALAASSVRGGSTITPSNPAVEIFQLTWLTHEYYQIVAVLYFSTARQRHHLLAYARAGPIGRSTSLIDWHLLNFS